MTFKKSLSLVLVLAIVISMAMPVAFALDANYANETAELTVDTASVVAGDWFNDTDPRVSFSGSWTPLAGLDWAFGGDQHFTAVQGAYFEITFAGTGISYIGAKSFNLGYFSVYLNGNPQGEGHAYAPYPTLIPQQELWQIDGLEPGYHVLRVVVMGSSPSTAATAGNHVTLDAFVVRGAELVPPPADVDGVWFNDNDPAVNYSGTWNPHIGSGLFAGPLFYQNDQHFSDEAGAYFEITFTGTGISYIGATSNNLGIANIYLNDEWVYTACAFSQGLVTQQELWSVDGLDLGAHVLRVVVAGERHPNSSANHVTLDAFVVRDEEPSEPGPIPGTGNSIEAGFRQSFFLSSDGTVWVWGIALSSGSSNAIPAQAPGIGDVVTISSSGYTSLALRADGTVWYWPWTRLLTPPSQVPGLSDVIAISAGGSHSLALRTDGTVWAWGENSSGPLGDGTTTNRLTPVQVSGLNDVIAISAGHHHSLALRTDGTVWAWGANFSGPLGDGTTTNRLTPVQVSELNDVIAISAGGEQSMALRADGTVWAWGQQPSDNRLTTPVEVIASWATD